MTKAKSESGKTETKGKEKTKYSLDDLYAKIIDNDLMLKIGADMIAANEGNVDRGVFLGRMIAKDVGTLVDLYMKHRLAVDAGKYDITRGAHTFMGSEGFAYGACAWVSKEARRGGFEIKMPTKNKSNKKDKQALGMLFGQLSGIKAIETTDASPARQPDMFEGV